MARSQVRIRIDRGAFREFASSAEMAAYLLSIAERGKAIASALAPTYTGPTWANVARAGDYKKSLNASLVHNGFAWQGEFGANVAYTLQVEFGSGRPATSQERPQEGRSPRTRVLGRALDALRI